MSQYTPHERKQIADALRQAKPLLKDPRVCNGMRKGRETFICSALLRTRHPGLDGARREIMNRLRPEVNAGDWLFYRAGINYPSTANLQIYRHLWVDALIKEFES